MARLLAETGNAISALLGGAEFELEEWLVSRADYAEIVGHVVRFRKGTDWQVRYGLAGERSAAMTMDFTTEFDSVLCFKLIPWLGSLDSVRISTGIVFSIYICNVR